MTNAQKAERLYLRELNNCSQTEAHELMLQHIKLRGNGYNPFTIEAKYDHFIGMKKLPANERWT